MNLNDINGHSLFVCNPNEVRRIVLRQGFRLKTLLMQVESFSHELGWFHRLPPGGIFTPQVHLLILQRQPQADNGW